MPYSSVKKVTERLRDGQVKPKVMFPTVDFLQPNWLALALEALEDLGLVVVSNTVPDHLQAELPAASERLNKALSEELGRDYTERNLRTNRRVEHQAPLRYEPYFYSFLELDSTHQAVEAYLGPNAVLRGQTFEHREGEHEGLVQSDWHMNFKVQGDGVKALDVVYVLDDLTPETSCLEVVLGSHRRRGVPDTEYLEWAARPFCCSAGSLLLMDARVWHRERSGCSSTRQVLVHQIFVPHWVKPFFDFPRLLGGEALKGRTERVQTYLGLRSRPPVSLEEFALPPEQRPYQAGQWEL